MALPGSSSEMENSLGQIRALFMTKVTSAEARGFPGRGELIISRFLPKQARTCSRQSSSRCISCKAKIAICSLYMVRLTIAHFSVIDMLSLRAVAPFMFREAMLIFTFSFGFLFCLSCGVVSLGAGECAGLCNWTGGLCGVPGVAVRGLDACA